MVKWPEIERNHRLPDSERRRVGDELLKGYQAGKSIRQLCAESGYSIGRVRRLLVEAGVSFRMRGGARNRGN
jgi:hypothetical protein